MLDLESLEWEAIASNGKFTAQLIIKVQAGDDSALDELYQQLCHQNTVSKVAFAAVPHLISIARNPLNIKRRAMLLSTIGSIVASRQCYSRSAAKLPDEWKTDFIQACDEARILAAESLLTPALDTEDSFQLIGALAALHGHSNLALLLESGLNFYCPECGEYIEFGEGNC